MGFVVDMHAGYARVLEDRGVVGIFLRVDNDNVIDEVLSRLFSSNMTEVVEIAEQLEADLERYQ